MEVAELLKEFEEAAKAQYNADEVGNYRLSNKNFAKLKKITKELYKKDAIYSLKILLNNEHINVRFNAATELLPFYTGEAEKVLEEIATLGRHPAFTAKITLQEWRKGNIKFDY